MRSRLTAQNYRPKLVRSVTLISDSDDRWSKLTLKTLLRVTTSASIMQYLSSAIDYRWPEHGYLSERKRYQEFRPFGKSNCPASKVTWSVSMMIRPRNREITNQSSSVIESQHAMTEWFRVVDEQTPKKKEKKKELQIEARRQLSQPRPTE